MTKKATDIKIRTDNIYCPSCGAIQKNSENFCGHCGESLHKKSGEEEVKTEDLIDNQKKKRKPFYKNKIFLAFFALFLISASALAATFYFKSNEGEQYKTKVRGIWQTVYNENDALNKEVTAMNEMESFENIALKIKSVEGMAGDKQDEITKLNTPENYKDGKDAFVLALSDYKSYLQSLRSAADNPSKMTDQDIEDIDNLGETAKISFSKVYTRLDFIDSKLSDDTFTVVVTKFQEVRASYEEKLASDEQQTAEKERKDKQTADDKAKVESLVTSFMNAYIAGNENELKKYMSSAFQKEFNYADLSTDARMYSYPESFRITITKKTSDSQYDVYGRELQVDRESGSKWTINRHFAVVWVQSDSKWLVDRWDISSE